MATYSAPNIQQLLARGADKTLMTKARGDALEELLCYLLEALPGVRTRRNSIDFFKSAEIDIAVVNQKVAEWLSTFPNLFLIECKNWDKPVDSATVAAFKSKLDSRSIELGIIVATNGITGNEADRKSAYHIVDMAQAANRRILVITLEQLETIHTTEDFELLLVDRLLTLAATGGSF
ncbi:restriction endonuclease [Streptomyces sp. DSM 41527]|uniref:Restriction endonuclease n=1 Tax=Streptomyces mooreae TaxID=3075523 RepID=A0ABU2T0T3_9ACTN|nr:restriction endonuclease [Streptomyces sp. DSM 41527]MDT0454456.1 restriction endonuclease [Streptomyces sp. DSM 41527]